MVIIRLLFSSRTGAATDDRTLPDRFDGCQLARAALEGSGPLSSEGRAVAAAACGTGRTGAECDRRLDRRHGPGHHRGLPAEECRAARRPAAAGEVHGPPDRLSR